METITANRVTVESLIQTLKQARGILLIEMAAYPSIREYDSRGKRMQSTVYKLTEAINELTVGRIS